MVHQIGRRKQHRVVAILTDIAGQNMVYVLAGRVRAVVATNAIAGDTHVVEGCRYPAVGRMAIIAIVTTRDMGRVLADRDAAVVA